MNEVCPTCLGYVGTVVFTGHVPAGFFWCKCKPRCLSRAQKERRLRARLEGRGASLKRLMEEKQYREKVARDAISDMIELQRTYEER